MKKRPLMKGILGLAFLLAVGKVAASGFQNFVGINYANPADLAFLVKNTEFIGGASYIVPYIKFDGTVTVPDPLGLNNVTTTGISYANKNFPMFYGRLAKRLSDQWVIDLDVTEPFLSITQYPATSRARYTTTASNIVSQDLAPNLIYQFSGKLSNLAIGAGLDFTHVFAELNQQYPSLPTETALFGSGPDVTILNRANGWGYGYHIGINYHLFEGTFTGLSYYSVMTPTIRGKSSFTDFPASHDFWTKINLPATTTLAITQFFSENWLALFQFRVTQWNRLQQVILNNTAGPTSSSVLPFKFKNTWETDLSSKYTYHDKYVFGGGVAWDHTPTVLSARNLGLPEVNSVVLGVSAGYKLTKAALLELNYSHVFMLNTVPLNTTSVSDGTTTIGNAQVFVDVVGLQLTIDT